MTISSKFRIGRCSGCVGEGWHTRTTTGHTRARHGMLPWLDVEKLVSLWICICKDGDWREFFARWKGFNIYTFSYPTKLCWLLSWGEEHKIIDKWTTNISQMMQILAPNTSRKSSSNPVQSWYKSDSVGSVRSLGSLLLSTRRTMGRVANVGVLLLLVSSLLDPASSAPLITITRLNAGSFTKHLIDAMEGVSK